MQSSESASGSTNTINDNASSIRQGIQTLTGNLYLAQKKGVDIWTAVQAYNFGPAYIDFIAQNEENTLALAKQYSHETVAPFLVIGLERLIVIFTPFPFFTVLNSM